VNKKDLIRNLSETLGDTQAQAERYVNAIIDGVKAGIKKEGNVQLVGFGSFQVRKRAPRRGRNPQTGEVMQIKGGKTVTFRPGKGFKAEL